MFLLRCAFVVAALVSVCLTLGGVSAGPFRRTCRGPMCNPPALVEICPSANAPEFITPSPESKPEEVHVQQPWLLTSETENISSQPPGTVLEPMPGTGSKLGIGPKVPDKITHTLDKETIDKLTAALSPAKQPVTINVPIQEETSQRLSRISTLLEWLLWLAGAMGLSSVGGKVLPLVARLGVGLQSVMQALQPPVATTPAAPSYTVPNPSPVGNPAAPSSTPRPST